MLAGWVSWWLILDRTIFSFYAVAFAPFVAIALAMSCGSILGPVKASSRRRLWGAVGAGSILLLTVIAAWWWYPIWTGEPIPQPLLVLRIWMPTWV
jgi:dolichyl-phosphate-mannose--protein O-mannosyl transferase